MELTKACRKCGEIKDLDQFPPDRRRKNGERRVNCQACITASGNNNPAKYKPRTSRQNKLRREQERRARLAKYGLTEEDYDLIVSMQSGKCALCGNPPGFHKLYVDFANDKVRGLLCNRCYMRVSKNALTEAQAQVVLEHVESPEIMKFARYILGKGMVVSEMEDTHD